MNQGDKYPSGTQVVHERPLSQEGADATRSYLNVVEIAFSSALRYAGVQQPQSVANVSEGFSGGDQGVSGNYGYDQEAA